ncbi:type II toxin-antitoxin system PemK/MazF family toxin [Candidatus Acetothermia bacterium]|nr:type II toxin-antitoxin system PemK/MazF family toxin [Candidatus Acetothermia bacterium]MBI3460395.1 type II toxin-antitoxin system PemK/MazF family toxin [Candidatus Acetothermia bacterium]
MTEPARGDVWMVDLNPTRGHEQAGIRPGLVISVDEFNHGPAGLVVMLPITTKTKGIPFHVRIDPPEGGLKLKSFIKCEEVRSIAKERLSRHLGKISTNSIVEVEDRLRILLNL